VLLKHSREVYGLDMSREALDFCSGRGYTGLFHSPIADMCLDREFDLIVCMDVLEHLHDDGLAVGTLKEHLSGDGLLIISAPAHMYLWNDNDVFSHHVRRYELRDLQRTVRGRGLAVVKIGYWNQFGYLPCLLFCSLRKLRRKRTLENSLRLIPQGLDSVLFRVLKFENSIFVKRNLRQGVSIICVCRHGPSAEDR
jgi:SAM-dependent methyltransferase